MTEYRGVIAGTGDAVTGINEISGGLTARYLYNILGYSSGVLKDALSEFNMTYTNLTFSVAGGQAVAYGYIGEITTTSEFTFTAPSANSKYYFVYLDFDLRETIKKFAVSYYDNSNSDVWSPRQDNLANNEAGRFQLPIYKIKIDSDNTITVTDLREIKQIVKEASIAAISEATKINGEELKKDENGILKVGNVIIPQYQTIATINGDVNVGDSISINAPIANGDVVEFEFKYTSTYYSITKKIRIRVNMVSAYDKSSSQGGQIHENVIKIPFTIEDIRESSAVFSGFSPYTVAIQNNGQSLKLLYVNHIYGMWKDGYDKFSTSGSMIFDTKIFIGKITKIIE